MLKISLSLYPSQLKNGLFSIYSKKKLTNKFKRYFNCTSTLEKEMKIHIVPALKDNFMYIIADSKTNEAAVVDPVNPKGLLGIIAENDYKLTKILTTHHHWDHAGGNKDLVKELPNLIVYGGDDRIEALTCKVEHGSKIALGNVDIECLHTPCHTNGHISYFVTEAGADPSVFTGDTLFIGGCGRFFEGTAEQMYFNLHNTLGQLPNETKVYCGHEYTINNLRFGLKVEPNNEAMQKKMEWAIDKQKHNKPTVPSTIGEEKLINPFMRVCEPTVQQYTKEQDPIDVMTVLRAEKDCF